MPSTEYRERYDTTHVVKNPHVDSARAAVVKVQWLYDFKNGELSQTGRLGTIQPTEVSSDSEKE
jgi:hypothetical protein